MQSRAATPSSQAGRCCQPSASLLRRLPGRRPSVVAHRLFSDITSSSRLRLESHPGLHRQRHAVLCSSAAQEDGVWPLPQTERKGNCYGCGQQLQWRFSDSAGYVEEDQYRLKAKHKQLNQLFCKRCVALTHGEMVPGVQDFSQKQTSTEELPKILMTPDELREQLRSVRDQQAVVVMLVDLLDASGSFMGRVRDLIGRNPVVLVGTKADLLPKGTHLEDIEDWLADTAAHKRLNVIGVKAVSSRTQLGVPQTVGAIRKERKGRDVYVLGAANVGKSAFVRALLKEMGTMSSMQFDPAAIQFAKRAPTESAMPGTTLRLIPLKCFESGQVLYDTPGLHLDHRLPHLLTPQELKDIHPRRRLQPYLAPPIEAVNGEGVAGATYLWGGLVRIDVAEAPPGTQLAFYGPAVLKAYSIPLLGPDDVVSLGGDDETEAAGDVEGEAEEMGEDEGNLFGSASVARRGGLWLARETVLTTTGRRESIADIAISGLAGWISVVGGSRRGLEISIRVFAPRGVEVFVRPPMPVPDPVQMQRKR